MKNIIHIHVPKTGGSWLNAALKDYAGEHFLPARHSYLCEEVVEQWRSRMACPPARYLYDELDYKVTIANPAWSLPGKGVWNDSIKVSVCRNPFDLLVSMYHYKNTGPEMKRLQQRYLPPGAPVGIHGSNAIHGIRSFEEFIERWCDKDFRFINRSPVTTVTEGISLPEARHFLYYQLFHSSGQCGADVIIRNEKLAEGTSLFLREGGYVDRDITAELNARGRHLDGRSTREKRDYRSYYTDALREMVEVYCFAELKLFGYNFDGPTDESPFVDPKGLLYVPVTMKAVKASPEHLADVAQLTEPGTEELRVEIKQSQHIMIDVYWEEDGQWHLRRRASAVDENDMTISQWANHEFGQKKNK